MGTSGLDELLKRMAAGEESAVAQLLPRIYDELRALANLYMRRERAGHSLQPTALVHEAYLRLVGAPTGGPPIETRAHFLALSARAMRQVLVEHARARNRQKRGSGAEHVAIPTDLGLISGPDVEVLALHDALDALQAEAPRAAQAVELSYFGGLTAEEASRVLGVSARTVERDLRAARTWLRNRLDRDILVPEHRAPAGTPAGAAPPVPARIGRYPILGTLGAGGSGTVYLARDPELERDIALKRLTPQLAHHPEAKALLRQEARVLAALQHPNIATVFSLEEDADGPFLTLERVDGRSLAELCGAGPLPSLDALEIVRQIAHAMEAAAQVGIVHGDLTPANVLVGADGRVKVVDFGLARRTEVEARTTHEGSVVVGTPGYLSPERRRGAPPSAADDLFAFGCLLFETLTGLPAFPGSTAWERLAAAEEIEPRWDLLAPNAASTVAELTRRCLAKDARERPTSMRQARRRIEIELLRRRADRRTPTGTRMQRTSRLPLPRNAFVGREELRARIGALLDSADVVSLTGAGGVGKTRLALEVAAERERVDQAVVWVDLTRAGSLEEALLEALAIQLPAGASVAGAAEAAIDDRLAASDELLVLDGAEAWMPEVVAFLTRPALRHRPGGVLTTSRIRIGVPGEERVEIPPLGTEDAVRLLGQRVLEASAGARLDPEGTTRLCLQLDGLPLALELAAARLGTASVGALLGHLDDPRALGSRRPDLPARHQNLTALVAWSEGLLTPEGQQLFHALGLLAPGWELEVVESLADALAIPRWRTLELLTELVDHSLVIVDRADDDDDVVRYRMLGLVASFAQQRCHETGRAESLLARIDAHHLDHVEREAGRLRGAESGSALRALGRSRPNWLRSLARFGLSKGLPDPAAAPETAALGSDRLARALRFVAALDGFWTARGLWPEAREWTDAVLAAAGALPEATTRVGRGVEPPPEVARPLAHVANMRGNLALHAGELDRAEHLYRTGLALGESLADPAILGRSMHNLGGVALYRERWDDAVTWFERAIHHDEEHGDLRGATIGHTNLGLVAERRDDLDLALQHHGRALGLARQLGDDRLLGLILNNHAGAALVALRIEESRAGLEESLRHHERTGDPLGRAAALVNLGILAMQTNRPAEARPRLREALTLYENRGNLYSLLHALTTIAILEERFGDANLATMVHAFAARKREEFGGPLHHPRHLRGIEQSIARLRERFGAEIDAAWNEGAGCDLATIITRIGKEP